MNGKTIGIISIKGGVGKTSSVISLAGSLAKDFNKKVLVVDANFSSPHLGYHVGLYNPEVTLHHVLDEKAKIVDAVHQSYFGFDIIPGSMVYAKINPLRLAEKLRELRRKYDLILIDSSPNLNEEILSAMIASDELLVVTTPDYVTLASTLRAIRLAKERRTPITGIILNKVYDKEFEVGIEEIEEKAGVNVLAVLPHEVSALEAVSKAEPLTIGKDNQTSLEYKKLAGALIGETYYEPLWKRKIRKFLGLVPKHEVNRVIYTQNVEKNISYF